MSDQGDTFVREELFTVEASLLDFCRHIASMLDFLSIISHVYLIFVFLITSFKSQLHMWQLNC